MKEIHNTGFPCTSCGACCKNIAGIKELESYDLGNGVCRFLESYRARFSTSHVLYAFSAFASKDTISGTS